MSDPAFPTPALVDRFGDTVEAQQQGLSQRAYFAARAMQGMCTGSPWPDRRDGPEIARRAVALADDLITALAAPPDRDTHEPFR